MTDGPMEPFAVSIRKQVNSMAIVSLILAIAGFCGWFMFYIGLPFSVGAAICGALALRRSDRMAGEGRTVAKVSMVLGAVMTLASIIGIILLFTGGSSG